MATKSATLGRFAIPAERFSPWKHRSGHLYVSLGRTKRGQVHRFVMAAFGPPCLPGQECRHLDGDPENNRIDNLAWGTRKENVDDLKRVTGRYARSLLSSEMAAEIRSKFTGKHGQQSQLAREYGFSLSLVNRIVRGKPMLLGIDPGTTQSGWAVLDAGRVKESGVSPNAHLLERIRVLGGYIRAGLHAPMKLAVERFEARGMPIGDESVETLLWTGRFIQAWHDPEAVIRVKRSAVKLHLCGSNRAKDANVRQALIDKMGPPGPRRRRGRLMA